MISLILLFLLLQRCVLIENWSCEKSSGLTGVVTVLDNMSFEQDQDY